MFYEQEAVHTEPNHKEDGRVKIDMQNIAVDNAGIRKSFFEVICIEVREAWQCAEKNKVRDCQVEKVDIAALPVLQTKNVT